MALKRKLAISGTGIVVGIVLIAIASIYLVTETSSGRGHWMTGEDSLTSVGWITITVGVMLIIISLVYLVMPTKAPEKRSVTKLYPDLAVISLKEKGALRSDIPPETPSPPDEEPSGNPSEGHRLSGAVLQGQGLEDYRQVGGKGAHLES